jgi:hypothetical protein
LSSAELYDPVIDSWSAASSMNIDRRIHEVTLLADGRVIATGGVSASGGQATAEVYEPQPCPFSVDIDCDGFHDPQQTWHLGPTNSQYLFDNCPSDYNPAQTNTDGNFIDNSPPYSPAVDDKTWVNSDAAGDACDADDDNDGLVDTVEATGAACGTIVTDSVLRDTDGDRVLDGAECALGTDPTLSSSKPVSADCGLAGDTDGDRISNRLEYCFYNSNPNAVDTDSDSALNGAKDGCEVVSINADRIVSSGDQGLLAVGVSGAQPYTVNLDINKDGVLSSGDQGLMATFISPGGQCP